MRGSLYVYLRRKGRSTEDSRDITQGFFAYLLKRGVVERALAAAAREQGLPLTADASSGGDECSAGSADA